MHAKIQKWGNSQGLRLAKNVLEDVRLGVGDEVDVVVRWLSFGTFLDKLICRLNLKRVLGRLSNQYFKERPISL